MRICICLSRWVASFAERIAMRGPAPAMAVFFVFILFFGNLALEAGERQILIKVAQYPNAIEFNCPNGAAWELGGRKKWIKPSDKCKIEGTIVASALKRFHVIVADIPFRDAPKTDESVSAWKAAGWPVHTIVLGREFSGPGGRSFAADGRRTFVGVGIFGDFASAGELVASLSESGGSPFVHEEVVNLSQGRVTLKINGEVQAVGQELALEPTQMIHLYKVEFAAGYPWHGFEDRDYRGRLLVRWGAHDALDCVLQSDLDSVLAGIVPSEISAKADVGALQAQAVAARGEIMSSIGVNHAGEGFDTCSEQHCQVYGGETPYVASIALKIAPTRGMVLAHQSGSILDAVYASNCGGHGEANHLVWTTEPDPVLIGIWDTAAPLPLDLSEEEQAGRFIRNLAADCFCNDPSVEGGDKFRWNKTISAPDWKTVESKLGIGRIKRVTDLARGFSGRIYQMSFIGDQETKTVKKELTIRQLLGSLRSSCFIAAWKLDSAGYIVGADLSGAGFGHGVGMCQTGAQALAKRGWTFDRILAHYYPGSLLKKWY